MKKLISGFITLIILIITNSLLATCLNLNFLELSFVTGLVFTIVIGFFSSEGGFTTGLSDMSFKHLLEKEYRTNSHFIKFQLNIPFTVSLIYTIVFSVFSLIVYWKYF